MGQERIGGRRPPARRPKRPPSAKPSDPTIEEPIAQTRPSVRPPQRKHSAPTQTQYEPQDLTMSMTPEQIAREQAIDGGNQDETLTLDGQTIEGSRPPIPPTNNLENKVKGHTLLDIPSGSSPHSPTVSIEDSGHTVEGTRGSGRGRTVEGTRGNGRNGGHSPSALEAAAQPTKILPENHEPSKPTLTPRMVYTIEGLLGKGGMGSVYKVTDKAGREYAFKTMDKQKAKDHQRKARFNQEYSANAGLNHANLLTGQHIGDVNGVPGFFMDIAQGGELSDLISTEKDIDAKLARKYQKAADSNNKEFATIMKRMMDFRKRDYDDQLPALVDMVIQICAGVSYMHSKGYVHRDLKPDNVLLPGFDQLQVMDFGLAKHIKDKSKDIPLDDEPIDLEVADIGMANMSLSKQTVGGLTRDGSVMGTPIYMAPEQARGEKPHFAWDQYAIGAILYEIITRKQPGAHKKPKTVLEVLQHRAKNQVAPIGRQGLGRTAPKPLISIVEKAMSANPKDRYAGVDKLAEDLKRWRRNQAVEAHSYSTFERVGMWAANNGKKIMKYAAGGLLAATITIAGAVGYGIVQKAEADATAARQSQLESELEATTAREEAARQGKIAAEANAERVEAESDARVARARELERAAQAYLFETREYKEIVSRMAREGNEPIPYHSIESRLSNGISQFPDCSGLYAERASARYNQQDYATALSDAQKSIELDPKNGLGYEMRGLIIAATSTNFDDALKDYDRASEFGRVQAYMQSGDLLRYMGEQAAQQGDVEKATRLYNESKADYQSYLNSDNLRFRSEAQESLRDIDRRINNLSNH